MTDNEIIKALECCIGNEGNCDICPQHSKDCVDELMQLALDLINRQKAEIERCENIIRLADKTIKKQSAEIERLAKGCGIITEEDENWYPSPLKTPEEIKAEAVKEFAERLKKVSSSCVAVNGDVEIYGTKTYTFKAVDLDKLVIEMVGDAE